MDFSSVTGSLSDLSNYVRPDGTPAEEGQEEDQLIEFVTEKELYGAIPEPIPANKVLPDWYRELGQYISEDGGSQNNRPGLNRSTVKRCVPFMEAMTMGWIIPLPAELHVVAENGDVDCNWEFERELISGHSLGQVGGDMFPGNQNPILKFHNYWNIKVPSGYTVLFTNPMNRPGQPFVPFSGVVDLDNYFNFVNFPFMWIAEIFDGVLPAGTPMIQAIPFKRDTMLSDATARSMSEDEALEQARTKTELSSHESTYRDDRWIAKDGSRMIPQDVDK